MERHRPESLDGIVGHENIITAFKRQVEKNQLGRMLRYGPAGPAKELNGPYESKMVLELNASDERGIDVVRNQIKTFVSTGSLFAKTVKCLPKMVILDEPEPDQVTGAVQASLRRLV